MAALRSGEYVPPPDDGYDPEADMRVLRGVHKRKPKEAETYMTKEQLTELRRVQAQRVEVRRGHITPTSLSFLSSSWC